tara:strand:- start:519 stop:1904 length:1386 start_codon:yes stop_codon:yes gene_type:complete
MDNINIDEILNRTSITIELEQILSNFYSTNINNEKYKKGIYIYGNDGIGKTKFIINLLKKLDYDIIYYDNSNSRNKSLIENICTNNLGNINVLTLLQNKPKKMVVVFDEIDGMNYGDKSGLTSLTKLIRNKKTKKQKTENITSNPIICINNFTQDKKITDLMKVCNTFKLNNPSNNQLLIILNKLLPNLFRYSTNINKQLEKNILIFLDNKLIKINNIIYYEKHNLTLQKFNEYFLDFNYNHYTNIKNTTKNLLGNYYEFNDINKVLETDRTIVSLLYHENVIYLFKNTSNKLKLKYYLNILDNFIYSDYIDRIIFQKQIWQLNDICYIIKIFYNNYLLNSYNLMDNNIKIEDIIFTKVLTKYSSEYNNKLFFFHLCQMLNLNRKDLYIYFYYLKQNFNINEIILKLEINNVTKLEIIRLIKLLNIYVDYNNNLDANNSTSLDNELNLNNIENINSDNFRL